MNGQSIGPRDPSQYLTPGRPDSPLGTISSAIVSGKLLAANMASKSIEAYGLMAAMAKSAGDGGGQGSFITKSVTEMIPSRTLSWTTGAR
jgi:hypothetical protein